MQRIEITQDFALPVDRVYAFLSEHENLGPLLGAKITRVCATATPAATASARCAA